MAGHPAFPRGYQGGSVKSIDRCKFLVRSGLAAEVVATLSAVATAQGIRELKLVTIWPKGLPVVGTSAERMSQSIPAMLAKRIRVSVSAPADWLVHSGHSTRYQLALPTCTILRSTTGRQRRLVQLLRRCSLRSDSR